MNPNAAEEISWDTDDHGQWTAYLGWNGAGFVVLAETGGSAFILDDPDLGLLNTGILGPTADGWTNIGCDLLDLEIRRGATQDGGVLLRAEAGTCHLTLSNINLQYEPFLTDTFPLGLGTRIAVLGNDRATVEFTAGEPSMNPWGEFFQLFHGRIESVTCSGYETEIPVAEIVAVDDTLQLQNYNGLEQSAQGAGETTELRLQRILETADWSVFDPALGLTVTEIDFVDVDDFNPTHQSTTLAQPSWEMMLRTADAANRIVYFKGNGQPACELISPTTHDTWLQYTWGCVEDVDVLTASITSEFNKDQLINVVDAARTGGSQVTVTDETSVLQHGAFRWGRNDLTLENDTDVEVFAGFIVNASSNPAPRVTSMRVVPSVWPSDTQEITEATWDDNGFVSDTQRNAWNLLLDFTGRLAPSLWRQVITAPIPGSDSTIEDTVALRGVQFRLDADVAEFGFVTTSIRQFIDVLILDDPDRGLLNSQYVLT